MRSLILFFFKAAIRSYQIFVSPLMMPACRFTPSCSQYASEALEKYGIRKGLRLAWKRLTSCHPWGKHGHDPVP